MVVQHPGHGADVEAVVGVIHEARVGRQHRRRLQIVQPAAMLQRDDVCHAVALLWKGKVATSNISKQSRREVAGIKGRQAIRCSSLLCCSAVMYATPSPPCTLAFRQQVLNR